MEDVEDVEELGLVLGQGLAGQDLHQVTKVVSAVKGHPVHLQRRKEIAASAKKDEGRSRGREVKSAHLFVQNHPRAHEELPEMVDVYALLLQPLEVYAAGLEQLDGFP